MQVGTLIYLESFLSQKRVHKWLFLATKDYQVVVKTNVISGIANMYYTLLMLDKQLDIVNNMEKLTKENTRLDGYSKRLR